LKRGEFVREMQRMLANPDKDASHVRAFDEMVEMAQRDYPDLMQGDSDPESALMQMLSKPASEFATKPAWHEDTITEALEYMDRQQDSEWEPDENLSSIPFAKQGRKWLYRKLSRLRKFRYARQQRLFNMTPEGPRGVGPTQVGKVQGKLFDAGQMKDAE